MIVVVSPVVDQIDRLVLLSRPPSCRPSLQPVTPSLRRDVVVELRVDSIKARTETKGQYLIKPLEFKYSLKLLWDFRPVGPKIDPTPPVRHVVSRQVPEGKQRKISATDKHSLENRQRL